MSLTGPNPQAEQSARRVRLKVCCIASIEEMRLAAALGADLIGLVARMPTGPGPIEDVVIRQIAAQTPVGVGRVLLTAQTEPVAIADHAFEAGCDVVQIVQTPSVSALERVRSLLPATIRLMPVVHVQGEKALAESRALAGVADALLLDSGSPRDRTFGGTGQVHDWSISAAIVRAVPVPVWLAGGLNPANIASAVQTVRPFGVDLCSGIRTHGRLDARLGRSFVDALWQT